MHALAEECGAAGAVGEERGCRGRASVVVARDVVQRVHLCREEIYLLNFGHGGPAEVPPEVSKFLPQYVYWFVLSTSLMGANNFRPKYMMLCL